MTPPPAPETRALMMALADACEKATGADDNASRALGREVLLACGKGYVSPLYAWHNPVLSIDAAMSLVAAPGKWSITLSASDHGWEAWVWMKDGSPPDWRNAATPALALTAACLRSRASTIGDTE